MGRVNSTNSNQRFQQLYQNQEPEAIDHAPPPPPPPPPPAFNDNHQDLSQPPIESPDVNGQPRSTVQSFNPPSRNDQPQAFPPPHHETPQAFPPPPESHLHHQPFPQQQTFHQPQVFQYQPSAPHGFYQPAAGGGVYIMTTPAATAATPSPFLYAQIPSQPWKSGLFDCMNDPENALITACFPCVTFGQIAEILDSGNTSCSTSGLLYGFIEVCIAVPCIMSFSYRTKLRSRYNLIESPAQDWVVHCFCEWCALCQEYRELKQRDIDPAIGWHGNLARQQQQQQFSMAMAAPMQQRMM